jgi:hypothetical protein
MHGEREAQEPTQNRPDPNVLLTVVYDSGMDARLTETLDELGVSGWTKLFDGHGRGGVGRKENTPVWPGTVNMLYIVLAESDVERVVSSLRALQQSYRRNPGLTIWTQPVTLR